MKVEPMQVRLTAISPVAFMFAKEGDRALLKRSAPKPNEYRDKIGPAGEAFLVFKGETKIGMIPRDFMNQFSHVQIKKACRIVRMDQGQDMVIVELFPSESEAT